MITDSDFLSAVLPQEGMYCVTAIDNNGTVKNIFVNDVESIQQQGQKLVAEKTNAFFALASYKQDEQGHLRRKQEYSHWLKSFWIDVDCGEGKDYPDQATGLDSLDKFLDDTGLPSPFIINSGNGIHVYWLLQDYVTVDEWRPVAGQLKAACRKYNFNVDFSVMSDTARVLRIPGTCNFKDLDNPKAVQINKRGDMTTLSEFATTLESLDLPKARQLKQRVDMSQLSETAKALMGNKTSKFNKIVRKSVKDNGCAFIKKVAMASGNVSEPMWRAALSIAWACEDGEKAIHMISKGHPEYDPDDTYEKASLTVGPLTCAVISADIAPDLCKGCTQNCTSPIQLGTEIKRAPDTSLFDAPEEEPEADGSLNTQTVKSALYKPPFPYFRGAQGGIYREDGSGDEKVEILVYDYDLYPVQRLNDPNDGESVLMRLHLPQDGVREFIIPAKKMMATDSFRDILGQEGVIAGSQQMKEIMNYTIKFTKELQKKHKAQQAHLQYGWDEAREKIIIGPYAYTDKGVESNPASSTTVNLHAKFTPTGSLDDWKKVMNLYKGPGFEELQFTIASGFGSLLMPFTGLAGATINLISNESGTGKSTAGLIAVSMFADIKPQSGVALVKSDTPLSRLHRVGVMNNLPVMSDEMTGLEPHELSQLLYSVSQGRARHRMEKDVNRERTNLTTWQTIFLSNSNSSFMAALSKNKGRPDGEMMRLMEMHVNRVQLEGADEIISLLNHNYGVAGPVYAQWCVKNREKLTSLLQQQRDRFKSMGLEHRMQERFWTNLGVVNLAGLRIGSKLGLCEFDVDHLEDWFIKKVRSLREEVSAEIVDASTLVGEFLMENANGILAVGTKINPRSGDNIWMPARSAKLVARFELENNLMFISKKSFREYCVARQFTESEALKDCMKKDAPFKFVKTHKKRMMSGTNITAPAVQCHVFEISPEESSEIFSAIDEADIKDIVSGEMES